MFWTFSNESMRSHICKLKFKTRMVEYSVLQAAKNRFYFENLLMLI